MIRELLNGWNNPGKTAVIEEGKISTYGDLARKATALQRVLGAGQRENIAIFLPNCADYISALFGVWMSGMTAFLLNVQLTAHEIAPLLEQASVRTVVTSAEGSRVFKNRNLISKNVELLIIENLDQSPTYDLLQVGEFLPDEPIALLTTSGTTGSAKIVQLSEKNIEAAVLGFIAYNDFSRFNDVEIRYILGTPFSSVYALLILPVCVIRAFPLIITRGAFTLNTLYSAVEKYGVTHYEGGTAIPILMEQMLGKPIPYDIDTLRFVGFGGSKVSSDILRRLDKAFPNIEFCPGYGMTESSSLIARPYKRIRTDKRDSIGMAIPNVTVCVEKDDVITDIPLEVGELVVKGPNVMLGYYNNNEETRRVIKGGWLYTGDIGYIDNDGDIFISGRKKNVIMVRGFSVYAEEVETCLQSSGLIKDCVVYGETDAAGAEWLCTDVIPMTADVQLKDITAWCASHLALYKQPRRIKFTDSFLKTATGKIERGTGKTHGAD